MEIIFLIILLLLLTLTIFDLTASVANHHCEFSSRHCEHSEAIHSITKEIATPSARNDSGTVRYDSEKKESDGQTTLKEITELPDTQRKQILIDFAGKHSDENLGKTIVDLFREEVAKHPHSRAVVFKEKVLTYKELDDITDKIAANIEGKGDVVGILVNRSEMMPVCALGVMKSGATYMPLDPNHPSERLKFMLEDANVSVVIADEELLDCISDYSKYFLLTKDIPTLDDKEIATPTARNDDGNCHIALHHCHTALDAVSPEKTKEIPHQVRYDKHCNDRHPELVSGSHQEILKQVQNDSDNKKPSPNDTMILLYTSGTTGKPKGVMLTHGNLVNFCTWYKNNYSITNDDNIAAYASFGFDANMMDMYPALISGACVHIIPEEMRLDLPGISDYFSQNNISVAFITTQLGRQFAETVTVKNGSDSLRVLSVGGETLVPLIPPDGYALYNLYGPTECSVLITSFCVDKLYDKVPIGRALDNTSLYIVDKQNHLAPVGVAGELCVAGRQVGKGYLNRPDLTSEKFVLNPFNSEPDYAVMYRTGDIARFLPDGNIDFMGRNDFQVKIRGFRVELTEIEERILKFPNIKESVVIASDAPGGGKCAVAYIVSDFPIDVETLNNFIEEELPYYMVPATTMQLDAIPLNINGKVDRHKLPAPIFSTKKEENTARPLNDLEAEIFRILTEILEHKDFGFTTNLLRAGLTSLLCIKLVATIDKKIGVSITVGEVMKTPTILGIGNAIINQLLSKKRNETVIQKEQYEQYDKQYPLSQTQMGIYYECIKNPDSLIYNIPVCVTFDIDTDTKKLQNAIMLIVAERPALRTRIFIQENEVQQMYTESLTNKIEITQLAEIDIPKIKSTFVRPFNLFDEALFRANIYKTESQVYLLLDFHHIIFDGYSLDLFMQELSDVYQGNTPKKETFTLFDAALLEKEKEKNEEYKTAKDFFANMMKNSDGATEIPNDRKATDSEGTNSKGISETVSITISKSSITQKLEAMGITAANLFLGTVGFVTSRFANTKKVGIAVVSTGRGTALLQNTMGMFVKTLPIVINVDSLMTSASYLLATQEVMYDAMEHELYPYTLIASEFNYHPQILYAYQGTLVAQHSIDGKLLKTEEIALHTVKFPISITVEENDEFYNISIEYDSSLFDKITMQNYGECITHIASLFVDKQKNMIGELSIASPQQMKIINDFASPVETPLVQAVHHFFEQCANKTPDALAVTAIDGEFTYRQLNERANRIAHSLIEMGAVKGDKIAFVLSRTSHIYSVIYGILKAGCAFIPVDPAYPQERKEYILSDSGAKFIITDGITKEIATPSARNDGEFLSEL